MCYGLAGTSAAPLAGDDSVWVEVYRFSTI